MHIAPNAKGILLKEIGNVKQFLKINQRPFLTGQYKPEFPHKKDSCQHCWGEKSAIFC